MIAFKNYLEEMKSFKEYLNEDVKPSASYIKKNRLHVFGWGSFKHHLVKIGVIKSTSEDAPKEWMQAYSKATGGSNFKKG